MVKDEQARLDVAISVCATALTRTRSASDEMSYDVSSEFFLACALALRVGVHEPAGWRNALDQPANRLPASGDAGRYPRL